MLHARGSSLDEVGNAVETVLRRRPLLSMHALRNSLRVVRERWSSGQPDAVLEDVDRSRSDGKPTYANPALTPKEGQMTPRHKLQAESIMSTRNRAMSTRTKAHFWGEHAPSSEQDGMLTVRGIPGVQKAGGGQGQQLATTVLMGLDDAARSSQRSYAGGSAAGRRGARRSSIVDAAER